MLTDEWQPIETMPVGVPALVYLQGFLMLPNVMTKNEDGRLQESAVDGRVLSNDALATHWMPLPQPPMEQTNAD
jgi:hypothetical protein